MRNYLNLEESDSNLVQKFIICELSLILKLKYSNIPKKIDLVLGWSCISEANKKRKILG